MSILDLQYSHQLPHRDIKRRIQRRYDELKGVFNGVLTHHEDTWHGEKRFEASCKFLGRLDLKGSVDIDDAYIRLHGEVPTRGSIVYALNVLVKKAEHRARRELDYILSANYHC